MHTVLAQCLGTLVGTVLSTLDRQNQPQILTVLDWLKGEGSQYSGNNYVAPYGQRKSIRDTFSEMQGAQFFED